MEDIWLSGGGGSAANILQQFKTRLFLDKVKAFIFL